MVVVDGKFMRFGALLDSAYESFIERRFLVALLFSETFSFEPTARPPLAVARDAFGITLGMQVPVGPYFVDFTLTHDATPLRLAIELDGHAFHRRTAREAEYEARRERQISEEGWTVLRFTGAEVMREPGRVARQAYERLRGRLGPGLAMGPAEASEGDVRAVR